MRIQGQRASVRNQHMPVAVPSHGGEHHGPHEAMGVGRNDHKAVSDAYALADTAPEAFDAAIEEAPAEGNLSRANVVRCHGPFNTCACGRGPRYCQGPPTVPPRNDPTPQAGLKVEPCVQYGGVVGPVERKVPPPDAPGPALSGSPLSNPRCVNLGRVLGDGLTSC